MATAATRVRGVGPPANRHQDRTHRGRQEARTGASAGPMCRARRMEPRWPGPVRRVERQRAEPGLMRPGPRAEPVRPGEQPAVRKPAARQVIAPHPAGRWSAGRRLATWFRLARHRLAWCRLAWRRSTRHQPAWYRPARYRPAGCRPAVARRRPPWRVPPTWPAVDVPPRPPTARRWAGSHGCPRGRAQRIRLPRTTPERSSRQARTLQPSPGLPRAQAAPASCRTPEG
ncbi:hypothetical protein FsymDg_2544 [Candidatus Protofrankia datiscae]|uniref:Uncharacterized protein n=1 Tax=Candidatus Protofrankia datiscae TaxID=2716812 RepID=F8B587_9ACTN|nr:hypothetical protein FsymDg_2544 [Candidatus Protofrankia datiscae]